MANVDMSELLESVTRWADQGAGDALDRMRQRTRDKAPYGASESGHDGPHLVDTEEATIISESPFWQGTLAYTADHASYLDEGTGPHEIRGNPLLSFQWGGGTVIVRSVQHPGSHLHDGWFSDTVTPESWADEVRDALDSLANL